MRKNVLVLLFLLFMGGFVYAEDKLELSGYIKNESSMRTMESRADITKQKEIIELAGQYKIKDDELVVFAKAKYWYDFAYSLRDRSDYDRAKRQMQHIQRTDWLRDCYLDYTNGPWFLRLGKQQVAWGQADGITILDRVNPVDLTEYWLPDMVDIRIPLWMANINYAPKLNSNLQFLIIPDFEASTAAPSGAPFVFRSYQKFYEYTVRKRETGGSRADTDIYLPPKQFENSTFALQWQDKIGDLTYTLNYLTGYYYSGRTYLLTTPISGASTGFGSNIPAHYGYCFKRWQMYGSSFNKTFTNPGVMQGTTLRGEFAYFNNEPTYYGNIYSSATNGVNRWDNKFWLIGADRYFFTKLLVSGQFAQYIMEHAKPQVNDISGVTQYVMNAYTYGPQDPVENIFTLKLSTNFMNDRIKPEILWSFTDDNQGRLSPKVTYEIRDNLLFTLGLHYFYGNEWDSNGQFRNQNQLYTQLKYSF